MEFLLPDGKRHTCTRCEQPCPSVCERDPFRGLCHACTSTALTAEREAVEKLKTDLQAVLMALEAVLPEVDRCMPDPSRLLSARCDRPWMVRHRPYANRPSRRLCDAHAPEDRQDGEWHEAPWAAVLRQVRPVFAAHKARRPPSTDP